MAQNEIKIKYTVDTDGAIGKFKASSQSMVTIAKETDAQLTTVTKNGTTTRTNLITTSAVTQGNALKSAGVSAKEGAVGMTSMDGAVRQLGFAMGDAGMFAVNFRMGLMSIGNNLPFIAEGMLRAKEESEKLGKSFSSVFASSLTGIGGVVLAINVAIMAMELLTSKTSKQKEEASELEKYWKGIVDNIDKAAQGTAKPSPTTPEYSHTPTSQSIEKLTTLRDNTLKEMESLRKQGFEIEISKYQTLLDNIAVGSTIEYKTTLESYIIKTREKMLGVNDELKQINEGGESGQKIFLEWQKSQGNVFSESYESLKRYNAMLKEDSSLLSELTEKEKQHSMYKAIGVIDTTPLTKAQKDEEEKKKKQQEAFNATYTGQVIKDINNMMLLNNEYDKSIKYLETRLSLENEGSINYNIIAGKLKEVRQNKKDLEEDINNNPFAQYKKQLDNTLNTEKDSLDIYTKKINYLESLKKIYIGYPAILKEIEKHIEQETDNYNRNTASTEENLRIVNLQIQSRNALSEWNKKNSEESDKLTIQTTTWTTRFWESLNVIYKSKDIIDKIDFTEKYTSEEAINFNIALSDIIINLKAIRDLFNEPGGAYQFQEIEEYKNKLVDLAKEQAKRNALDKNELSTKLLLRKQALAIINESLIAEGKEGSELEFLMTSYTNALNDILGIKEVTLNYDEESKKNLEKETKSLEEKRKLLEANKKILQKGQIESFLETPIILTPEQKIILEETIRKLEEEINKKLNKDIPYDTQAKKMIKDEIDNINNNKGIISALAELRKTVNEETKSVIDSITKKLEKKNIKSGAGGTSFIEEFLGVKEFTENSQYVQESVTIFTDMTNTLNDLAKTQNETNITRKQKEIDKAKELWDMESKSMQKAGIESTAYYRNKERESAATQKKLEAEKLILQSKGWESEQSYRRVAVISDTIQATMKTYAQFGYPFGLLPAGIVASIGAMQLGAINSQENPYKRALGGWIPGNDNMDNVPTLLSAGEFVVRRSVAQKNKQLLEELNNSNTSVSSQGNLVVNITGNVIGTQSFVEEQLIPQIRKAIRGGHIIND